MKVILLCIALFCVTSLTAQDILIDDPAVMARVDTLNKMIKKIDLRINGLYWERYISIVESRKIHIHIYACKSFNVEKVIDTVPHLNRLHANFMHADSISKEILNKNRAYKVATRKLMNSADKAQRDKYQKVRNQVFHDLYSTSPEYKKVRDICEKALFEQNLSTLRYLIDYCSDKAEILETDGIIPDNIENEIYRSCAEIRALMNDRTTLEAVVGSIRSAYIQKRFNPSVNVRYDNIK